jgi:Tol biopolymer transport system component
MKTRRHSLRIGSIIMVLMTCVIALPAVARERIIFSGSGFSDGFATALFIANADGTAERKLLSTSEFDYSPSFSGDGKWIVFTSERSGPANIYRTHLDGSGLERLTNDPAFDDQAVLSPDGRKMAFVSTRSAGTADIWILDLQGHNLRNLTRGAGGNFRPRWSPDGHWLAFSSDRNTTPRRRSAMNFEEVQETSVYIMRADGTGLRRITPTGKSAGSPTWSADGKRALFYEMTADQAFDARWVAVPPDTVSQIVAVDVISGERTELTTGPGVKVAPQSVSDEVAYLIKTGEHAGLAFTKSGFGAAGKIRNPVWSPDGKWVVYQRVLAGPRVQNEPLFSNNAQEFEFAWSNPFPAFSPTGKLAVTTDFRPPHSSISVMNADGGDANRIFDHEDGMALYPSWSPDGQWIAFSFGTFFQGKSQPTRIMMMRPDGSEVREIIHEPGNSAFPSFSPDGKQLVYNVRGGQEQGLRIVTLADGSIRTLTTGPDAFPRWSPNDDAIEFTRAIDDAYDIFSIRADGSDLRRLTTAPGNDAHGVWSPDGKHILFSSARLGYRDESALYDAVPQPYAEIFIMDADGSNQRALTDNKWEDGTPAWQPTLLGK